MWNNEKKEYQECPLIDVPISTARTRSKYFDFDSDDFLNSSILKYKTYISELKTTWWLDSYQTTPAIC